MRYLPQEIGFSARMGGPCAASAEIPMIDDTDNSNVPGLYVVGETAGTALINLAMRSGRRQFSSSRICQGDEPAGALHICMMSSWSDRTT